MDFAQIAAWVGPTLVALSVAHRERSKRAALQTELMLETERQETATQKQLAERLKTVESRMDTQAEVIAAQASQIATLNAENHALRTKADAQAQLIAELSSDNVRLAGRVAELERERAELIQRSKDLVAQWEADKASPTVKTDRPPRGAGAKGSQ